MMKKSFAELELSFLHLQQNVKILEKHLITSVIQPAVEQVNTHYGRPFLDVYRHRHLAPTKRLAYPQTHHPSLIIHSIPT